MNEPKIYSISTVGILKHFHQDYLLHPLRTDFTGGNGVGKSIIADLIQIIFICYEKHIKFGTEGFTKEKREIRKLPYENTEAYTFLNVKTEEDRFITIGVNIQARSGKKVRPFLVLSKPDLNFPLTDLVYDSSKILTHKDFLNDQHKILPLDQLSKQLKEKNQLYLTYFQYNDDIQRYHSFLFEKEILPINLTITEHLKAFSKVIQSFSRVKDLGLDKANTLKEFLFEDDDKEFMEEYQKHKIQLDKLLTDFKELNNQIEDIEHKQKALEKLNTLEKHKNSSRLNHDLKEISEFQRQHTQAGTQEKEQKDKLDKKLDRKRFLEDRERKFEKIIPALEEKYDEIETNYSLLLKYESKEKDWKQFEAEITQLRQIQYDNFSEDTINNSSEVEFAKLKTDEIIKCVNVALPLFTQYGQLSDIIRKYKEQQDKLSILQHQTENRLIQLSRIIKLLGDNGTNNLFHHIVQQKKPLSFHQESVLLALIDLSLEKPEKAYPGLRYALSAHILDENNIEPDIPNNGVWLSLGELREFIPSSKEKPVFSSSSDFEYILPNKIEELNNQVIIIKQQQVELEKIKKGQSYDKNIIKEYDFDIRLIEFSVIKNLKEAVWIICNKETKITQLLHDSNQLISDIKMIKKNVTVPTENMSRFLMQYEEKKKLINLRKKRVIEKRNLESKELACINGQIPFMENDLKQKQEEEKRLYNLYEIRKQQFDRDYPEADINIENHYIKTKTIEDLKKELNNAQQDYISEYKSITGNFDEIKNEKNPQVNMQINSAHYQFRILEEVLLGGKIRYLDKVSDYLREANQQRLLFVGNIRDNMVKVFTKTLRRYQYYEDLVKKLNTFFIGKKISKTYYLHLKFKEYDDIKINWIDQLQTSSRWVNKPGEFAFGQSVQEFIEDLFKKITGASKTIEFKDLLNPKTYFDLEATLTDENKNEIPGSAGETYSALILLGIARLSKVQDKNRGGLKFIILEELSNLDDVNFNLFPEIAKEFNYQLLTMTPKPYHSDSDDGWYLYSLIKGYQDNNINYPIPASYYKTRRNRIDLENYVKALKK